MSEQSSRRAFLDTVLSVSAAVVALSALGVSIFQAKLARDQQRASVWPRLDLTNSNGPHLYARLIRNVGVGPAIVRNMEVTYDGRPIRDWNELATAVFGRDAKRIILSDTTVAFSKSTVARGSVILAGTTVEQIHVTGGPVVDSITKAVFSGRLLWTACYCSLYGDCWTTTSRANEEPAPVPRCPENANAARELRE